MTIRRLPSHFRVPLDIDIYSTNWLINCLINSFLGNDDTSNEMSNASAFTAAFPRHFYLISLSCRAGARFPKTRGDWQREMNGKQPQCGRRIACTAKPFHYSSRSDHHQSPGDGYSGGDKLKPRFVSGRMNACGTRREEEKRLQAGCLAKRSIRRNYVVN